MTAEPLPTVTQVRVPPFSVSILFDAEIQKNNCQYILSNSEGKINNWKERRLLTNCMKMILIKEPTVSQLLMKFPASYDTRTLIAMLTREGQESIF
jgi:hypothetical protein